MKNENYVMTSSLEDHLEAVFVLSKQKGNVRLTDIAEHLGVSKPSVNRAVNTLTQNGFLEHVTSPPVSRDAFVSSVCALVFVILLHKR